MRHANIPDHLRRGRRPALPLPVPERVQRPAWPPPRRYDLRRHDRGGQRDAPGLHHRVVPHRAARRTPDARAAGGGVQRRPVAGPGQADRRFPRPATPTRFVPRRPPATCPISSTSTGRTSTTTPGQGSSSRSAPASRQRLRADLLPSIRQQGTYAGRLWGLGTFDSGLGLYVRPSILRRVGARIPRRAADAWTASEFTGILHRLQRAGYRQPLDLQVDSGTLEAAPEWLTYGFAPAVWSAGGDLIDRSTYRTVAGRAEQPGLDPGAHHHAAAGTAADWSIPDVKRCLHQRPGADLLGGALDVRPPITRRSLTTSKIVPLPRFGAKPSSGMGSWQWGITSGATDGDAVWRFLVLPAPASRRSSR